MKMTLLASAAAAATALVAASAASAFPAFGADSQPGIIITFANSGVSTTVTGEGPYDGVEDSYIGVVNNSSSTLTSLNLNSSQCIGCFDGDGIDTYGAAGNGADTTGYGGPQTYFTNNTGYSLTANFLGGLAPGATTYFSLEEAVVVNSSFGVPEPATWALMLIGVGGIGFAARRRRMAVVTA
jgi:hypothetical protein